MELRLDKVPIGFPKEMSISIRGEIPRGALFDKINFVGAT